MHCFLPVESGFGRLGIFVILFGCSVLSCSKRGREGIGDSKELGESPRPPETISHPQAVDGSPAAGETAGGMLPEWEQKLETELRTVVSDMQILDGGMEVLRRGVDQLRKSLSERSLDELSAMVISLSEPAANNTLQRGVILLATLTEIASRSPDTALHLMMEKFSAQNRGDGGIAALVLPEIARKDPGFLSSWLSKTTTDWKNPTTELFEGVKALATVSMEAAFSFIEASPASANRAALYSAVFRQLGQTDPAGAVRKLETLDPKYRSMAIGEIAQGLSVTNKQTAVDWLKANKDTPVEPFTLQMIFDDWLAKDKDAAVESLKSLPSPMLLNVLSSHSTTDRLQRKGSRGATRFAGAADAHALKRKCHRAKRGLVAHSYA